MEIDPSGNPSDGYSFYAGINPHTATVPNIGVWEIHTVLFDGAGSAHHINGALQSTFDVGTASLLGLVVGARVNLGNRSEVDIADFQIHDERLSGADRLAITEALGAKYNIAVIPEPSTAALLMLGLSALLVRRRTR